MIRNSILIPRFSYHLRVRDFLYSLGGLWGKRMAETQISRLWGVSDQVFYYNYGRTALRIAISSLGLPPGSRIGVQAFNCETVFQSIARAGHRPVFIDISADFTLDISDLKAKSRKLDALIVTHTFGIRPEMFSIKEFAAKIPIIEDCAHSMYVTENGTKPGTSGDLAIFSFGFGKYPAIGKGGFLLCSNPDLLDRIRLEDSRLEIPSRKKECLTLFKSLLLYLAYKRPIYGLITRPIGKWLDLKRDLLSKKDQSEWKYYPYTLRLLAFRDTFYRQMKEKKVAKAGLLIHNLSGPYPDSYRYNHFFPITHPNGKVIRNRMTSRGYECTGHFSRSVDWARSFGYEKGMCPNTERIVDELITIPVHPGIPDRRILKMARLLNLELDETSR